MPAITLPPVAARFFLAPYHAAHAILRDRGPRLFCLSKGQVSLADVIAAIVEETGPADVRLSAWGIVKEDLALLGGCIERGLITRVRLHAGLSFAGEVDKLAAARAAFGVDNVSFGATHAKIATVRTATRAIAIRTSANLERLTAFEQLEVEDSAELCDFFDAYLDAPALKGRRSHPSNDVLARAAMAPLATGGRVFGLTDGYSLVSLIEAALDIVGPADVKIFAWRVSAPHARRLRSHAHLQDLRVIMSPAFAQLERKAAADTVEALGTASIRYALNHAKIAIVSKERVVVIRASMNLNDNLRVEHFDASDEPDLAGFVEALFDHVWTATPAGRPSVPQMSGVFRAALGGGLDVSRYTENHGLDIDLPLAPFGRSAPVKPLDLRVCIVAPLPTPRTVEPLQLAASTVAPFALP